MRERLIGEKTIQGTLFTYALLAEELTSDEERYGVRISGADGETAVFQDVTVSRPGMQSLMGKLVEGLVTPVTLRDILEDWLGEL